ncbi:protein bud31 [Anaeramoeba ignava]|uniref:Protein bud31 n=1 Tax=Anaeramoeba ignava TaxID=1746090 RepID=A0A9Q0LCW9_ANAIG|nr:protein bud31 [Anaeramoeba ignava]KAJ5080077.1 protein bud31 [Anaeramoeba ignava]
MSLARRRKTKPPKGWEIISDKIEEFDQKMREAESQPHQGKRKNEALWPIFQINHQRSRYIFEMYYKKKEISKELFEYCVKYKIADGPLMEKWKQPGFERLCCLQCIQTRDTTHGNCCICRVPKKDRKSQKPVQCFNCGCRGCG